MSDTAPQPIEPSHFQDGMLDVGDGHAVYWRAHGNPDGPAVVILHGGPGSGHNPRAAEFFDPSIWRVVMFDQRGSGRSTPQASTTHNDTAHLVADMERLRSAHAIDRWALFGGSWGTRLALSYGVAHPKRCSGFMMRGVFLGRPVDIEWFLWDARLLFPDTHRAFLDVVETTSGRRPTSLAELLEFTRPVLQPDHPERMTLSSAWDDFELSMSSIPPMPPPATDAEGVARARAKALTLTTLEHHFMADVLPQERDILDEVSAVAHLPCEIVHGRYDVVCPFEQAWLLASRWPAATLTVAPMSGHWQFAPEMAALLHAASKRLHQRITPTATAG